MGTTITAEAGRAYGHVPGHQFLDVEITCAPCGSRWLATLTVTAGSAQESHGRNDTIYREEEYAATSSSAEDAIERVKEEALDGSDGDEEQERYVRTAAARALREACAACDEEEAA
ncbi:MAG: hypothetical protein KF782_34770 [Labilithrix sp.]|nr:hypothetical protein [Labilithrix sp.]